MDGCVVILHELPIKHNAFGLNSSLGCIEKNALLKVILAFFNLSEESVTFNTLKGLKNRGVKVELGFPYEMWDTPDAEVTRLKSRVRIFNLL